MRDITIAGFLTCVIAAVAVELRARTKPDYLAPVGTMLDRMMTSRSVRIGVLLFWWWAGWHFLVGQTV